MSGTGGAEEWAKDPTIRENLNGSSFGFIALKEMWAAMLEKLERTPAASEMGRLAQLLKAAGLTAPKTVAPPSPPEPGSDAAEEDELETQ